MDLSVLNPTQIMVSLIIAATPLLFAALGELVVEKSGVLNLGVEGMMIVGALGGFAAAFHTGSLGLAVLAGAGAGAAIAVVFGFLTQFLMSNQVATGLALTLFGLGAAAMLGQGYAGQTLAVAPRCAIAGLAAIPGLGGFEADLAALCRTPVAGPLLFNHDVLTYFSLFMVFAVWRFLSHSRAGLVLRAVGEN
ncbi:MAG: ABC transporter permease, partial [Pseudomonadota bacterium]